MALRASLAPQPHLYLGDLQGRPLDAGKIFFGEPSKDPELYPIDVFYDEALTIAAPQPIRTMGGFMNANGQMVEVYASETEYSVKALDGYGRQVFYQENMSGTSTSASVSTKLPYIGAADRNMADKNTDYITPKDFGAIGNTEADLLSLSVIGLDEGGIIHTDNRSFTIAASNATDYDAITVGGAKLYINKEPTSFETRAEFVTAVEDGLKIKKDTIIQAGNVSYIYDKTSTKILDLPKFRPFGEAEFEHYGGKAKRSEPTQAVVSHYRLSTDKILDVVRIVNPRPDTFQAIEHPEMNPANGVSPRLPLRTLAKIHGAQAAVNSVGFINTDESPGATSPSIKPYGLYISNSTVITDWNTYGNTTRDQVMLCMKDGSLQPRYKSDGGTAQNYVDEGAVWGFGWGVWCLLDGVAQSVAPNFSSTEKSARTIIGQAANGDYIIITAEGVTGNYGLAGSDCAAVALEYGCVKAFICDGGGSSQLWWDKFYTLPSSDNSFADERTLCTALAINCNLGLYDTGWIEQPLASGYTKNAGVGVRTRQVNAQVNMEMAVNGSFTTTAVEVLANGRVPRYLPDAGVIVGKGVVLGVGATLGTWNFGTGITMKTVVTGTTSSYLAGSASWAAKHAPSNTTP